jgi:hypothetical protein
MMIKQVFLQHDKARPHASLPKREEITTRGGIFSHILATVSISQPPIFNFLTPLKNTLRGTRFAKNLELKHSVIAEHGRFSEVVSARYTASHTNVEKVC